MRSSIEQRQRNSVNTQTSVSMNEPAPSKGPRGWSMNTCQGPPEPGDKAPPPPVGGGPGPRSRPRRASSSARAQPKRRRSRKPASVIASHGQARAERQQPLDADPADSTAQGGREIYPEGGAAQLRRRQPGRGDQPQQDLGRRYCRGGPASAAARRPRAARPRWPSPRAASRPRSAAAASPGAIGAGALEVRHQQQRGRRPAGPARDRARPAPRAS